GLTTRSAAARDYLDYLKDRQDATLAGLPGATPRTLYTYRVAFDGFAADLTPGEAAALGDSSAVAHVFPDVEQRIQAVDPGDPSRDPEGFACNNKLIGARYDVDGFGTQHLAPGSFVSPRDDDGHGTHTASTAAGNFGVDPSISGNDLGVDLISGIAPRARVAM